MNQAQGKLVCFLRKRAGLSQTDLGKKLFVEQSSISRWERGTLQIDHTYLEKLSKEFNLPIECFYQPEDTLQMLQTHSPLDMQNKASVSNTYSCSETIFSEGKISISADVIMPEYDYPHLCNTPTTSHSIKNHIPIGIKLLLVIMSVIIIILGSIVYIQNMQYTPVSYLIVNERSNYNDSFNEDIYEIAVVYEGYLTKRAFYELKSDLTIFWLTQHPSRNDFPALKVYCYSNEDSALEWNNSYEYFYIHRQNKGD